MFLLRTKTMFNKFWKKFFLRHPKYVPCDVCFEMMQANGYGICEKCMDAFYDTDDSFYKRVCSRMTENQKNN